MIENTIGPILLPTMEIIKGQEISPLPHPPRPPRPPPGGMSSLIWPSVGVIRLGRGD